MNDDLSGHPFRNSPPPLKVDTGDRGSQFLLALQAFLRAFFAFVCIETCRAKILLNDVNKHPLPPKPDKSFQEVSFGSKYPHIPRIKLMQSRPDTDAALRLMKKLPKYHTWTAPTSRGFVR